MRYIDTIVFPNADVVNGYFVDHDFTYPWNIFFHNAFEWLCLKEVTILYGNNGSGKSTVLNLIAEKIHAQTSTKIFKDKLMFDRVFEYYVPFDDFVKKMKVQYFEVYDSYPIRLITSNDIFKRIEKRVEYNINSNENMVEVLDEKYHLSGQELRLNSLDEYDEFVKIREAQNMSRRKYVEKYVKPKRQMMSNGETVIDYFYHIFMDGGVYLLDEPENCLSPSNQQKLVQTIKEAVRFFGCQFIIATHSPIILSIENASIYNLDKSPVTIENWNELENVKEYYNFFAKNKNKFEK